MAGDWHVSASEDREILSDWIRTLCVELETDKPTQAFLVLQETLHAIRDFLPVDRAIILSDMLPFIIRCVYFAGWTPFTTSRASRSRSALFNRIGQRFGPDFPIPPEDALIAVFSVLRRKLLTDRRDADDVLSFRDFLRTTADT